MKRDAICAALELFWLTVLFIGGLGTVFRRR